MGLLMFNYVNKLELRKNHINKEGLNWDAHDQGGTIDETINGENLEVTQLNEELKEVDVKCRKH